MESLPLPEGSTGLPSASTCPTPMTSPFMLSLVVARSGSTSNASDPIWQSWRSPSGFSRRREVAMLQALPTELQRQAFFRCWTRKEAYIKARGEGLSLPWTSLTCRRLHGKPDAILGSRRDPSETCRWSVAENFPSIPAMRPLLPWKDTTGVLPVGDGPTRGSNQAERDDALLSRAHLSASRLTTK